VEPYYLVARGTDPSVLDEETLDALADEAANAILRESARLPEREKRIVLGIVQQFGETSQGTPREESNRKQPRDGEGATPLPRRSP